MKLLYYCFKWHNNNNNNNNDNENNKNNIKKFFRIKLQKTEDLNWVF